MKSLLPRDGKSTCSVSCCAPGLTSLAALLHGARYTQMKGQSLFVFRMFVRIGSHRMRTKTRALTPVHTKSFSSDPNFELTMYYLPSREPTGWLRLCHP